jgi:ubiquinone/menaquinone biosynthesis C-methylase UbiE
MDATSWDERYSQADLVWTARPNVFAVDILSEVPPGDAIDLAAGEGRHAVWLATLGWNVTAVDFSAAGLARAEQWAAAEGVAERMTTVVADVTEYQPAPDSTDLLLLAYLQLPTEQRRQAIRNTVPAVRPGGLVVVIAHDSSNLTSGTGGPPSPEMLYSPIDVEKDLADCAGSWVIMRSEVAERAVADAPRPALDAVVVARRQ